MITRNPPALIGLAIAISLLLGCAPAAPPTATPKPVAPAATATALPAKASPAAPKPAAPSPTAKPAADQPRYGGALTLAVGGDAPSLDIHQEDSSFTYAITMGTYNLLVRPDPKAWPEFKPVPELAAGWQVSTDGKVYTFNLTKGAKFHDGSPVTSEDVKFSLDRIRNPQKGMAKSPRKIQLEAVTSIDTPDENTVKITLANPQAFFVSLLGTVFYTIMPKKVVLANDNDMRKTVSGSGPFKFKSYSSGVGWELVKNPDYFVKGRPYLDGVKGYIVKDSFTRFAALRTKQVLWWTPFPYMSVSQAKILEETLRDKLTLKWGFHPAWYGAIFNMERAPWSDARLRQAVSMSFDRKSMVAAALEGAGVPGMSPQPPGEWALKDEEMSKAPGYAKPDVVGAKKLLADAGFPNGLKAEMLVRDVKVHQDTAIVIKDAAASIGITLDLKVEETAPYTDAQYKRAFGIAEGGVSSKLMDPALTLGDFYVTGGGRNWSGYSNKTYDDLFAKQSATLDPAERLKIVYEMQRILLKDVPIAIAFWTNAPYAWWNEVRGFYVPVEFSNAYQQYGDMWLAN
ncbi:MAG: hypothetical protein HYX92_15810 [Chloroflexi bacterium]|nr:hypothetical protein [Chloroflexota bacterium]